jgi:SAM-dependent methyltransferase
MTRITKRSEVRLLMAGRAPDFDAERVRLVRQRWSSAAETLLGPATELMLDVAGVEAGMRVLDVGAGAGDQTIRAAARVGQEGSVLAIDVSEDILRFAEAEVRSTGVLNVEFRPIPCEQLSESNGAFDAAISRNGLQYLTDLPKGLARIHRALRPGGKLGAVVWGSASRNGFLAKSFAIARRRLHIPSPGPDDPDPFKLGEDGAFESTLENAGFRDVRIESVEALAVFASTHEALLFQQEAVGELVRLLAAATDLERSDAWEEIEAALHAFEKNKGFIGPGVLLVGSGLKNGDDLS